MIRWIRRRLGWAQDAPAPPPEASPADVPDAAPVQPAIPRPAPVPPTSTPMLKPKYDVFISYSHADRAQAVQLEADLGKLGLVVWRDDRLTDSAAQDFIGSINEAHRLSGRVLVLWSDHSVHSHWVREEAEEARNQKKVVCLALAPFGSLSIPIGFRTLPTIELTDVAKDPALLLRALGATEDPGRPGSFTLVVPDLSIEHLPPTFATTLFGRDEELALLTDAWDGTETNVIAFDAVGGAGKTALTVHFVDGLRNSGWRGARAVFAWSFYSQGSNEDKQSESTKFFEAAFAFFAKQGPSEEWKSRQAQAVSQGLDAPVWPPKDEREKGAELARHVQARRALFILDGLEPLQYAAGATGGKQTMVVGGIKDPAVKTLLEALIKHNPGLCLVSTRIELREFRKRAGFRSVALDRLDTVSSMRLLRGLGVEGTYPSTDYLAWREAFGEAERFGAGRAAGPPAAASGSSEPTFQLPKFTAFRDRLAQEIASSHVLPDFQLPKDLEPELTRIVRQPIDDNVPASLAFKLLLAAMRFDGHALSLTLVGNYLRTFHDGRIEAIDEVPLLEVYGQAERNPYSVMRAIEIALARHLADPEKNPRQHPGETDAGKRLAILLFLGFFDRPAPASLLKVVFPAIQPVLDPTEDPPVEIEGLEKLYRKPEDQADEWKARALRGETERRALFRALFPWTAGYSGKGLAHTLGQLAAQGLIHKVDDKANWDETEIDCHPLVREYFGARLRALDPKTFEAAHGRLYDWFRYQGLPEEFSNPEAYAVLALVAAYPDNKPYVQQHALNGKVPPGAENAVSSSWRNGDPKKIKSAAALLDQPVFQTALQTFLPEDAAGMEPLFAAITHGCLARPHDECWSEVYWPRVTRGGEDYACKKLGLFGQDLAALASFFEEPFGVPSPLLNPSRQALVLNCAGYALRALGRLPDAVAPMRAGAALQASSNDWKNASSGHGNLSELLVTLGRLEDSGDGGEGALATAARAVAFADQSGDLFMRLAYGRTVEAAALLARGRLRQAEDRFREAERLQKERQPSLPRLYSVAGFLYGDLLLARGRAREVAERVAYSLPVAERNNDLISIALDLLNAARASASLQSPASSLFLPALQKANHEEFLTRGYLALAQIRLEAGDLRREEVRKEIHEALTEAETIATRGPMPLFLADAHLLAARTALALGLPDLVPEHRDEAARLIRKHHYGRREPDLAVLDAEIAPNPETFRTACDLVGTEGWWHLLPRLEAIAQTLPGPDPQSRITALREAETEYNQERDAYLASQAY